MRALGVCLALCSVALGHLPVLVMLERLLQTKRAWALLLLVCLASTATAASGSDVEFGIYDLQGKPSGLWTLASAEDLQAHRGSFISAYNTQGGLKVIRSFSSGNCCIALKGGFKLTVSDTAYGFQFPSSGGKVQCNPKLGYFGRLTFFKTAKLSPSQTFGAKPGCSTNHNPAVFIKRPPVQQSPEVQFGLYGKT